MSDWLEDIALVIRKGRELSGSKLLRLLGVRAGSLLACKSVRTCGHVERVVLWDPIPNGVEYLETMRRIQATVIERGLELNQTELRESMHEYVGYRLSERMVGELRSLDASTYSSVPKNNLYVVSTSSEAGFPVQGVSQDVARPPRQICRSCRTGSKCYRDARRFHYSRMGRRLHGVVSGHEGRQSRDQRRHFRQGRGLRGCRHRGGGAPATSRRARLTGRK